MVGREDCARAGSTADPLIAPRNARRLMLDHSSAPPYRSPMVNSETVPVIDLGPYLAGEAGARERIAAELKSALITIGFSLIVNHGVPGQQIHLPTDVNQAAE
jgi:hypothetical protein